MTLPDEPHTRLERYLARLAGQDVSIPDTPITRIECYLAYLIENGGGAAAPSAGAHNAIFRGQSLGTSFTADQSAAIQAGTFEGLFVGDYWTITNIVYRIAGFNTFLLIGDDILRSPHVVVVPDNPLYNTQMNATDTSTGGYAGSLMRTTGLNTALETIKAAFGESHLLTRRSLLTTAVTNGVPSSWRWEPVIVDLMTEGQLVGRGVWGAPSQNGYNVGSSYSQFPLFALSPQYIRSGNAADFWLQDVRSDTSFSEFRNNGALAANALASSQGGVRPYFCIA